MAVPLPRRAPSSQRPDGHHELGFRGALVNDHTHGRYLDDPAYDELWSALEELQVPLYLHPGSLPTTIGTSCAGGPRCTGPAGAGRPGPAATPCG
ncbi:amidohydrolase family protein [Streptomyces yatensis]|uniref:amidohydrolase family protein n=1 Tax=Streptomyces yatensis TaxID=155177 RepID=UPI001FE7C517|nr:amidohydrolase family protein [Streptomyces yatensis]